MDSSDDGCEIPVETNLSWQEHLMELVSVRPCLYDKGDRDYFDKDVKRNNWDDVARSLVEAGYSQLKDTATGECSLQMFITND